MNRKNMFKRALPIAAFTTIIAIASVFGFGTNYHAYADDRPDYRLQISPLQLDLGTMEPGKTYTGEFEVQNSGAKAYEYATEIAPYSVKGQDYVQDLATGTKYTLMTDWVTVVENATGHVEPNGTQRVKYSISVPENAPAGSQSAAIIVSMVDHIDVDASGVQTVGRIAYYFYANIAGETHRTGEILTNKIPSFLFAPPITVTSTVKNTGNIYTEASYKLEIRNFFGNQLAYSNETYKDGEPVVETHIIFPETERYNEISWDGAPMLGLFKVKQTVKIFDAVSEEEKLVFLCPIWFLVLIILLVAVMVFWLVSRITRRKKEE